jgi:tRNA threonylcarbamoyladenosine biosynthesis protein TsaE
MGATWATAAFQVETGSPAETEALGERWAAVLEAGDVLVLSGDLGSGKTTLVRGLARGLGVTQGVKSPSFALHLRYPGRLTLHHLDLYRVTEPRDLSELGVEDVLGKDGVAVIEWGERLGDLLPPEAVHVRIEEPAPERRRWCVHGPRRVMRRLSGALGRWLVP